MIDELRRAMERLEISTRRVQRALVFTCVALAISIVSAGVQLALMAGWLR